MLPDYVLDGPARARPCPRPLKGSSYSFSARCRPASGPKPRSATARPLLGPFLAPAPRGLLSPQPDYVLEPRERRRRPRAVVLGPVVQYRCWWQRILSPINTCTPRRFYTSRKPRADTRVRPCKSAGRGLCRGVRDLFLRALVVENDAGENVHQQGVMDLVENDEKSSDLGCPCPIGGGEKISYYR